MNRRITSLRMERQGFLQQVDEAEYVRLYRDLQPGQNVYWNGFGQPPTLTFRAAFDDLEFNRQRQRERRLIKGRFGGGNLGWIMPEDLELFAALYRKPLTKVSEEQRRIWRLIETTGPLTIQQIKEETGLLVKQITPILHRLQEAFLVYEDQYDGDWERGWYRFEEMFPQVNVERYSRQEALKIVLQRFAYRMVWFTTGMAKNYYKIPEKEIQAVVTELVKENVLTECDLPESEIMEKERPKTNLLCGHGYVLRADAAFLADYEPQAMHFVYPIHRNDVLYKAQEPGLKELAKMWTEGLEYDHEPLQYLLIDGEFHGASVGHFRNGPYDLNDVVCDLPDGWERREEMVEAIRAVNFGKRPQRFMGEML